MDFNSLDWIVVRDISIFACLFLILLLLIKLCCKHCHDNSDKFRRRFREMSQNASSTQQLDRLLDQPDDIVYQRATTNAGQMSESDDDY